MATTHEASRVSPWEFPQPNGSGPNGSVRRRPRRLPPHNVSLATPDERAYWALALNCTEDQLAKAIEQVGTARVTLQKYLKERRTPPIRCDLEEK